MLSIRAMATATRADWRSSSRQCGRGVGSGGEGDNLTIIVSRVGA
jgi:hypothetical protein